MEKLTTNSGPYNVSNSYEPIFKKYELLFWIWSSSYLIVALVAVIGNSLVLYASMKTRNMGRLRFFDSTIKSLAFADLMIGLIGIPGQITTFYIMGKQNLI